MSDVGMNVRRGRGHALLLIRDGITLVVPKDEREAVFYFRGRDGAIGERTARFMLWRRATANGWVVDVEPTDWTIEALELAMGNMADEIARFRAR